MLMPTTRMCTKRHAQADSLTNSLPSPIALRLVYFLFYMRASCRDAPISGIETKQQRVRKQQRYSHLKAVYFESGTASLSVAELIKSKGHHLQTRHPPKGEHLIPYAAEEASQHPKNTALLEERCSYQSEGKHEARAGPWE